MEKYRRVFKEQDPPKDGEIRVTTQGRVNFYVSYATRLLIEGDATEFLITATGQALSKAVQVAEVVKRRIPNLHQVTKVGTLEIEDEFEPLEEGLGKVVEKRPVSFINITISKVPLDENNVGYQKPLDPSLVEESEDTTKVRKGRRRKGGKGAKGEASYAVDTRRDLEDDADFYDYEHPEVTTPKKGKNFKLY